MGFRVSGLIGFRVIRLTALGLGFRAYGDPQHGVAIDRRRVLYLRSSGSRILGYRVQGYGLRAWGLGGLGLSV